MLEQIAIFFGAFNIAVTIVYAVNSTWICKLPELKLTGEAICNVKADPEQRVLR